MFFKNTRQPVLFYDAKGGNGGGDGTDTSDDDAEGEDEEDNPDGKGKKPDDEQEKINRLLGKTRKEARETARKELWASLGVKTQEEFDAYLKAKKDAEDSQKTELQKAKDDEAKAKTDLEAAKSEHKSEVEKMQKRIIDTEIKIAASKQVVDKDGKVTRAAFHSDFLDDIPVLIDRSEIKLDEDGKVVGIEKALEALAKSKARMLAEVTTTTTKKTKGTPAPEGRFKTSGSKSKAKSEDEEEDDEPLFNTL